jgi:hypothetical protein
VTTDDDLEQASLREAAATRKRAALALRDATTNPRLLRQLDIAIRLFDDIDTLFLAHVDSSCARPNDHLWLTGADAYFRAACVFLDGIQTEVDRLTQGDPQAAARRAT